jgi:hypothetical protein
MKRVFFISIMALACMVCTTSCGDDEPGGGDATLTGITVTPPNFKGAEGAEQKITVTAVPAGAPLGTLTWASSATSVATVDQAGIVKIVGVGTAEITVTAGTFSQKVSIEGIISGLTVTDGDGNAGVYPYNGTPIIVNLTATIAPPNSGKTPVWSSSAATATVVAGSDGLTAEVTITGEGTAIITAEVDGVTATYTISTSSVFETAVGYWTFDDLTNLGAATRGGIDLVIDNELVTVVDGPVDGNGAVRGSLERKEGDGSGYGYEGVGLDIKWDHPMTGQFDGDKIRNFTMLLDVKVLHQDRIIQTNTARNIWDPIYWNGKEDTEQAGLYIAWEDRDPDIKISANLTGGWDGLTLSYDGATLDGNEPWIRFVFSFEYSEDDPENMTCRYYVDGKEALTPSHGWNALGLMEIVQGSPVYFMTKRKFDKEVKGQYDLSTLAVWDHVLTPEDIASLGGVSK